MAVKKHRTAQVPIRFDEEMKKLLEKEAAAKGLDLASYIRSLVFTHPDRQKK
jgi:uncharacterized protein (DUF1778 family)